MKDMNSYLVLVVVLSSVLATIGILESSSFHKTFAQMDEGMSMNQTETSMMKDYMNINGSINIMDTMFKAISSKVNVTLTQAISTAEQTVGNDSHAMYAKADEKNGFMVYTILLVNPDMKFYKAFVDPGNGKVLFTKEISKMAWIMMMHPDMDHGYDKTKMKYGSHDYDNRDFDKPKW